MTKPDRQKFTAGVVLVLFGLGFYLVQRLETIGSEVVMLIIGAAFLVAYFYQKSYGLLIPACVLLGLGAGNIIQDRYWWATDGIQLGLGLGFIAIYIIARLYERDTHWWPLIPGIVLVIVGVPKTARIFRFLYENWPLILVAIGLIVLITAFRRTSAPEPESQAAPAPPPAPETPSEPEQPVEPKIE